MTMSGHDCKAIITNEASVTSFLPHRNKQHTAIVLGLGGLYPEPETVQALLAPNDGEKKRILDLGRYFALHVECMTHLYQDAAPVSGVFIYESCIPDLTFVRALAMASDFPHCEVVGIDLAPVPVDLGSVPSNCRFEIDGMHFV
jgi:hypothetical protein